ncbi:hypothetical protein [Aquipseudomonas alcaligenes]
MSGHVGLREEARLGHQLAQRIARLFPQPGKPARALRRESPPCR